MGKVFERFVKVNNFAQGTGLGLSICKTIIERLDGHISVSSDFGKGTTFTFTLPLPASKAQEKTAESGIPLKEGATVANKCEKQDKPQNEDKSKQTEKTILIAEDTDSNYILTKAILGNLYHLERVKDGMEAVTMYEELHPDLILMDMKMPNLGGLDATKIIREISKDIPIIALTAYAYENDKQAALAAGCNDFLTKPYTQETLKERIRKFLKEESHPE